MSWDAYLETTETSNCPNCQHILESGDITLASWNYTHNTNGMIAAAYEAVSGEGTVEARGPLGPVIGPAWWDRLNGATADDGSRYLHQIITGLEADPARFIAMNPENGWGSYDSLLQTLHEMRDGASEHAADSDTPVVWRVSG